MSDNKPVFHMVRGVPGSGKSTIAKSLNCLNLEADMFFMQGGKYCYDLDRANASHQWCFTMFTDALSNRMDVVVSNTFCKNNMVNKYLRVAHQEGYSIIIHECYGKFGNIHNVPLQILTNMQNNFTAIDEEYLDNIGVTAEVVKHHNEVTE